MSSEGRPEAQIDSLRVVVERPEREADARGHKRGDNPGGRGGKGSLTDSRRNEITKGRNHEGTKSRRNEITNELILGERGDA